MLSIVSLVMGLFWTMAGAAPQAPPSQSPAAVATKFKVSRQTIYNRYTAQVIADLRAKNAAQEPENATGLKSRVVN